MKVNITVEIKPGTNAATGTAQRLIEQVAIAVASNETSGRHELVMGEKKEVYASAEFTVTADAPVKPAKT
jgi:hypothetical protein